MRSGSPRATCHFPRLSRSAQACDPDLSRYALTIDQIGVLWPDGGSLFVRLLQMQPYCDPTNQICRDPLCNHQLSELRQLFSLLKLCCLFLLLQLLAAPGRPYQTSLYFFQLLKRQSHGQLLAGCGYSITLQKIIHRQHSWLWSWDEYENKTSRALLIARL